MISRWAMFWIVICSNYAYSNSLCSNSTDSNCTSCIDSYLISGICSSLAPYGYNCISYTCDVTSLAQNFINTDFSTVTDLTLTSIGDFSTAYGTNFQSNKSPLLTVDRGLYFINSNLMKTSQNYVPSPKMTIKMWVKISNDGLIFTVNDNSQYISISYNLNMIDATIRTNQTYLNSMPTNFTLDSDWLNVLVSFEFSLDILSIQITINYFTSTFTSNDENSIGQNGSYFTYYLGDLTQGFSGFLYIVTVSNIIDSSNLQGVIPPDCEAFNYWDKNCIPCPNCTTVTWCIRSNSCSICNSPTTTACYGYGPNDLCDSSCASCIGAGYLNCSTCNTDFLNFTDYSRCLPASQCPTGYSSSAGTCVRTTNLVFNVTFNVINNTVFDSVNGIAVQSGSNDSFYPNYFTDDVWAAKNRGYYFTTTSFMVIENKLILAPEFAIGIWILALTNGIIFTRVKSSTNFIVLSFNSVVNLEVLKNSTVFFMSTSKQYNFGSWDYLQISKNIIQNGENYHIFFNQVSESFNSLSYYTDPIDLATSYLGDFSLSFTGFIWNVQVFTEAITATSMYTSGSNCIHPISLNNCLPTCGINQFFDVYSCIDCANSCQYSCGFQDSCNLCDNILCDICESYSYCTSCKNNSSPINSCSCNAGYFQNVDSCTVCDNSCSTCTINSTNCLSCAPNYLNFSDYSECLPAYACPTGYVQSGTTCTLSGNSSLILNATFNVIQDTVYDTVSSIPIQSSNDSLFYPNYGTNDVWAAKGRGYYFHDNSFMIIGNTTSQITLAPSFTILIWTYVTQTGIIFTKSGHNSVLTLKVGTLISGHFSTIMGEMYLVSNFSLNVWTFILFSGTITNNMETITLSTINSTSEISSETLYIDPINSVKMVLGDPSNGFEGFVWSIEIYNNLITLSSVYLQGNGCIYPSSWTNCLPTCDINQFFNGTSCINCLSSCAYSCGFVNSCNLCDDILCETCPSYSTCSTCMPNSNLTSNCQCNQGFVQEIDECIKCDITCFDCTNATYSGCISCNTDYLNFTDYSRCFPAYNCPTGFTQIENTCTNSSNSSLILNATFNLIQDIISDSVSAIPLQSGPNSNFYPSYGINDVWVAKDRGFYFQNTSYMEIDNQTTYKLAIGPEFTISIWILIYNDGIIFNRKNISTNFINVNSSNQTIYASILQDLGSILTVGFPNYLYGSAWNLLVVQKSISGAGDTLSLGLNGTYVSQSNSFYYIDPVSLVTTRLGDPSNSFIGFIYSIQIYNEALSPNLILSSYLPVCSIDFFYSNSCVKCSTTCLYSCGFADSCNLCDDILCLECSNFVNCSACIGNSTFNSSSNLCTCNFGFSPVASTCVFCDLACASCNGTNYTDCIACNSSHLNFTDYSACLPGYVCPTGYQNYSQNTCTYLGNNLVFSATFDVIQDLIYDSVSGIPIQSGSNSSFYPNYTTDDVWAAKGRGYYFTPSSYLAIDGASPSKLILAPHTVISLWIFIMKDGVIFTRSVGTTFYIYLAFSNFTFNLNITQINFNASLSSTYNPAYNNTWNLVEIVKFIYTNGETFYTRINSNHNLYSSNYFYIDPIYNVTTMLGDNSNSFTGYIYSMMIYARIVSASYSQSASCYHPTSVTSCLPTCAINEFYSGSCNACPSYCNNSCGWANSCNLCDDILCVTCSNYSFCTNCTGNATYISPSCQCNTGFSPVRDYCVFCDLSCLTCNGTNYTDCLTCKSGFLNFSDYNRCLPCNSCPNGFHLVSNACVYVQVPLIFNVTFNVIQNVVYDTVKNIPVLSGSNSYFYPTYDVHDAWAAKGRGYYFTGSSYLTVDNQTSSRIVLAPEFSIAIWIFVMSDGIIFTKSANAKTYIQINCTGTFAANITQTVGYIGVKSTSPLIYNAWVMLQLSKTLYYDGEMLMLSVNNYFDYSSNSSHYFDPTVSVTTFLGFINSGFQGYIYSISIYNQVISPKFNTNSNCFFPSYLNSCLPNCSIGQFYALTSCSNCPTYCSNSCGFVNSCNLCDDILCVTCANYSYCSLCTNNSFYNQSTSLCQCNNTFAAVNETCEPCHYTCLWCSTISYLNCTICNAGFLYFSDYSRCLPFNECPFGYGTNQICAFNNTSLIFNATFNELVDITNDTVKGIPIQSGIDSNFYLNYQTSDVYGTPRGFYFRPTSYLHIGPNLPKVIDLGPVFTLSFWILLQSDGMIFQKSYNSLSYLMISHSSGILVNITCIGGSFNQTLSGALNDGNWKLLEITKNLLGDGEIISVMVNGILQSSLTYGTYYKNPMYNSLNLIGPGFQGFLWSFTVNNQALSIMFHQMGSVYYPISLSTVLPICSIHQYPSGNTCLNCNANCLQCLSNLNCSMCPDSLCSSCANYSQCYSCKNNATLTSQVCVCDHLFAYNSTTETCQPITCFTGCYNCLNTSVFGCILCDSNFTFLNKICVKVPTGYNANGGINEVVVFSIKLNTILGVIYDSVNNIPVITGNSENFYPNPDSEDPSPAYLRGYYFNGVSSVLRLPEYKNYTEPPLILASSWGVQITLMPTVNDTQERTLLYSVSSNSTMFWAYLNCGYIFFSVMLEGTGFVSVKSNNTLILNQWNTVYLGIVYNQNTLALIYINKNLDCQQTLGNGIFVNVFTTTSINIAGGNFGYYKGFIFSVEFDTSGSGPHSRRLLTGHSQNFTSPAQK